MRAAVLAVVAGLGFASFGAVAAERVVKVPASAETDPVDLIGEDAADDPAIWLAADPAKTLIIGTQKKSGLFVYDLSGQEVQRVPSGRPNNIDLRPAFAWAEGTAGLLVASDRTDNTLTLWRLDDQARRLESAPRARIATGWGEVYGLCLGAVGGETYLVATSKIGEGAVWQLIGGAGDPTAQRIASFKLGSIAEGCVVDDASGRLYIGEEMVGIWQADLLSPQTTLWLIDQVTPSGRLTADVEGLALYHSGEGETLLIASVQGKSAYAVYDLSAAPRYVASFRIGASRDGKADAVSGTDGIEVTSAALPGYPQGLFIAQDDENTRPRAAQNFKLVSWAEIAAAIAPARTVP